MVPTDDKAHFPRPFDYVQSESNGAETVLFPSSWRHLKICDISLNSIALCESSCVQGDEMLSDGRCLVGSAFKNVNLNGERKECGCCFKEGNDDFNQELQRKGLHHSVG